MSKRKLPKSWAIAKLKDVVSVEYGKGLPERDRKEGDVLVVASGGVVGTHSDFLYDKPIVVTGRKGSIGSAHFVQGKSWVIDTAFALVPSKVIDPKFLYRRMSDFNFKSIEASTAIPSISREALYAIDIEIPPLGEQKRIVSKIESTKQKLTIVEETISKAEKLMWEYKEALLQKAFCGELVPHDPQDEPTSKLLEGIRADKEKKPASKKDKVDEIKPINPDEIPFEIPNSWSWLRLSELEALGIISDIQDGNHGEIHPKASDYVDAGIPFVMANNIANNKLDLSTCKFIRKSQAEKLRIGFSRPGDVLLTHKGTVGNCAIVPSLDNYIMLTPQVTYYRIGLNSILDNEFLYFIFQSPFFQKAIKRISKQATRDYVGITKQKSLLVPLPPINHQKRLVKIIRNSLIRINQIAEQINSNKEAIELLSQAIFRSAFEGRLVPQLENEGNAGDIIRGIRDQKSESDRALKKSKKWKSK